MDFTERARAAWVESREARAVDWGRPGGLLSKLLNVVDELNHGEVSHLVATAGRVRVPRDWQAAIIELRDDDLELVARLVDDDPVTFELYAIGQCRACHATVPLDPPATESVDLGAALEYEIPTDHECLGHPPVGVQT